MPCNNDHASKKAHSTYWQWSIQYIAGPALFLILSYFIYKQVVNQPNLDQSWQHIKQSFGTSRIFYLLAAVILMLFNWGIEALKWKIGMENLQPITFFQSCKAIFTGVAFSIATPNRIGEYLGRVVYAGAGKRIQSVPVTFACGMAQLWVTLLAGLIGSIFLKPYFFGKSVAGLWWNLLICLSICGIIILTLLFLRTKIIVNWLQQLRIFNRYKAVLKALEYFKATLWLKILSLSFLRYSIFMLQYILLFRFMAEPLQPQIIIKLVSVSLLVLSIMPTIALFTDLGMRGTVNMTLFSKFTHNTAAVGMVTFLIWIINLILPAVMGSVLILRAKNFLTKNNDDTNK